MARRPEAPKEENVPIPLLRARVEVVSRALDDVRALMTGADPVGAPADFKEREAKALAIFDEIGQLLPTDEPLDPGERAALEAELEDAPDEETMREILTLAAKLLEDPKLPPDVRAELEAQNPREALAALDRMELLKRVANEAHKVAEALETAIVQGPGSDARAQAIHAAAEAEAKKKRS